MSVENFNEHKRKKRRRSSEVNADWLKTVYNPKIFRRQTKGKIRQNTNQQPAENKVMAYIAVLVVVMVFILIYGVMRKNGLVD
jgi:hypothetical protein